MCYNMSVWVGHTLDVGLKINIVLCKMCVSVSVCIRKVSGTVCVYDLCWTSLSSSSMSVCDCVKPLGEERPMFPAVMHYHVGWHLVLGCLLLELLGPCVGGERIPKTKRKKVGPHLQTDVSIGFMWSDYAALMYSMHSCSALLEVLNMARLQGRRCVCPR